MLRFAPAWLAALVVAARCSKPTSTFGGNVSFRGQPVTTGVIFFLGPAPKLQRGMSRMAFR